MMHGTHNVTLTHCNMMHGTHNVTLTHCNMMHGTHNVKLIDVQTIFLHLIRWTTKTCQGLSVGCKTFLSGPSLARDKGHDVEMLSSCREMSKRASIS